MFLAPMRDEGAFQRQGCLVVHDGWKAERGVSLCLGDVQNGCQRGKVAGCVAESGYGVALVGGHRTNLLTHIPRSTTHPAAIRSRCCCSRSARRSTCLMRSLTTP